MTAGMGAAVPMAQTADGPWTEMATAKAFPCTVQQRKTWSLNQARPGDPTLNIAARWRLEGTLDVALLERAMNLLIDRHETLRTCFSDRDGVPMQEVLRHTSLRVASVDITDRPADVREAAAADIARDEARRPFDVTRPPLLRATLVRLGDTCADLLVTTHYLVGDCWSNGILAKEMADVYDALRAGRPALLAELDLHFGDYACWQDAWLKDGGADVSKAYWRRRLDGLPDFHVPADRRLPDRSMGAGDILGMPVPAALASAAQAMARQEGTTFFMFGVAALSTLLHRWTGAGEVVFGTQVAGREEVELESLVGPFVNTVALRIDLAGDPSFSALLDSVRRIVGEALEHAAAPIELVAPALARPSCTAGRRDPLTAVNFLIQRAFTRDAAHGDMTLKGMPNFSPGSKYDVNLFLVERPNGWRASCEYDPELFHRTRMDWLLRSFLDVLALAVADPLRRLSTIALPPAPAGAAAPPPAAAAAATGAAPTARTDTDVDTDTASLIDTTRLAALWAKVLRQDAIPADANFFALGGDSIRAAKLLALSKQAFGRTISLQQLFAAPTLATMALMLREDEAGPPAGIVMVQPNGQKPPIFAINNTGIFYTLSRHLGPDQPFIAVQALDPDVSPSLHPTDFQALAARYVEAIRQVRPHGPYALIGLCAAGKVALEVAQQLQAAGDQVPLLAVVDCWAPGHMRRMGTGRRLVARGRLRWIRLSRQLQRIREGTLSLRGFLANRAIVRGVRNAAFEMLRRGGVLPSVPPGVQNNLFVDYLDRAAASYQPRPYVGRVLVFYGPEQPRGRFLDPSFGWNELVVGKVDVVAVPADAGARFEDHHQGLFQDPGAKVMADRIAALAAR